MDYMALTASVRRMIPDPAGPKQMFDDLQLKEYLDATEGNVKLAVADIWDALAGQHLLIFKANVTADDGSVNAHRQSEMYRERAAQLREEAMAEIEGSWELVGGESC